MHPIDFFHRATRLYPTRIAIDGPEGKISYAELASRVSALAAGLQKLDPTPDSRVGIAAGNTAAHLVALLSVLAAGKVWIPLNTRNSAIELNRIVDFTKPTIVFAEPKYGGSMSLSRVAHRIAFNEPFDGATGTQTALARDHAGMSPVRLEKNGNDLQAIKFTGGSTGLPKGVMQPHRAWRSTVINLIHSYDERRYLQSFRRANHARRFNLSAAGLGVWRQTRAAV
jgi:fatty-acyl-CoA synthase